MKLVEILARELKEWPSCTDVVGQAKNGTIHFCASFEKNMHGHSEQVFSLADDAMCSDVTSAEWEAERARIALSDHMDKALDAGLTDSGDRFLKCSGNSAKELADIACGKRSKEDQELWDKSYFRAWELGIEDGIKRSLTLDYVEVITTGAVHMADKFMAERAKRMNG